MKASKKKGATPDPLTLNGSLQADNSKIQQLASLSRFLIDYWQKTKLEFSMWARSYLSLGTSGEARSDQFRGKP